MENNETYNWAPNDPGSKKKKLSMKKLGNKLLIILLVAHILVTKMVELIHYMRFGKRH